MSIEDILFHNLDNWRHLPSYQLERRADIFFAIYLPAYLEVLFNQKVQTIIPEFPVRVGTVKPYPTVNKSYKIDYVVRFKGVNEVLFIELKTYNESRRDEQDNYLNEAKEVNIPKLIDGIVQIEKATNAKPKYSHLFSLLVNAGFMDINHKPIETEHQIQIFYLQPNNPKNEKGCLEF